MTVANDWYRSIARPNLMFDASMFLDVYRNGLTPRSQKGFEYQVLLYKKSFASYYRSRGEIDFLLDGELLAEAKDAAAIQTYRERGLEAFAKADACIAEVANVDTYQKLQAFGPKVVDAMRDSIQYGTLVPYWILNAVERAGHTVDDPGTYAHVFEAFHIFRADARNLSLREQVYEKMFGVLARQLKISKPEILYALTYPEFLEVLKNGVLPDVAILEQRQEGCVAWYPLESNTLEYSFDNDVFEEIFRTDAKDFSGTEIHGATAQKGVVQGRVQIIFTTADGVDFKEGDIVVSTSTSPNLMPFLVRCGAIVTDEGGIASHAAIVSRELKKPCVIGTKIATQVLHNGDLVEVDADKGIVRILEKAAVNEHHFISPKLKNFAWDKYEFIGLWKCDVFAVYFWAHWFDSQNLRRLNLSLPFSGVASLKGGNFFYHRDGLAWGTSEVKKMLADASGELSRAYRAHASADFDRALRETDALIGREVNGANFIEIVDIGKIFMTHWVISNYFSPVFDTLIPEYAIKEGIPAEDVVGLIPKFPARLEEQHEDARRLLAFLKEKSLDGLLGTDTAKLVAAIRADAQLNTEFDQHLQTFGWIELLNYVGSPLSLERLLDQLKTSSESAAHVHKLPASASNVSKEFQHVLNTAADVGFARQGAAETSSLFDFKIRDYMYQVATMLGLEYREMLHLVPDEIRDGLDGVMSREELRATVQRRADGNWLVYGDTTTEELVVVDEKADIDLLEKLMVPTAGEHVDTLVGQIGNKGKVEGRVSVIMATDDFYKFTEGNILVTTMTTPDFVILMQKAKAIVTDIGGMLSHASIVSRELGKPCVIGTKFATQILHDGDLVEVDADKGIVKILEQAK